MSEVELTERLDQAIEAMVRNPQGVSPDVLEPTISELLRVAVELRHLPRADFKARLKDELEKETLMSTKAQSTQSIESSQSKIREGFRTVTPYLVVPDVHEGSRSSQAHLARRVRFMGSAPRAAFILNTGSAIRC